MEKQKLIEKLQRIEALFAGATTKGEKVAAANALAVTFLKHATLLNLNSKRQWRRELLDKTDLPEDAIAEYSGEVKSTGPVTISTYQILTYRKDRDATLIREDGREGDVFALIGPKRYDVPWRGGNWKVKDSLLPLAVGKFESLNTKNAKMTTNKRVRAL